MLLFYKKDFNINFFSYLIIFMFFYSNIGLHAEEVLLKSGKVIQGRITGQTSSEMAIETSSSSKTISKDEIIKVKYRPFTEKEKSNYIKKQKIKQQREIARRKEIREKRQLERIKKEEERRKQFAEKEEPISPEEYKAEVISEEEIPTEKELAAQETAERAKALRELVGEGKMEKPEDEPIEYWDFVWRSLVLPGWGHFTIDRPFFGTFYMVTSAALLSNIYETRRIAVNAQKENIRQVEFNYFLSIRRDLAPLEVRTFFVNNANAQAALNFEGKVDAYHNSLYSFGVLYGIQFLHIIYNAIAWENGLLIVKKDFSPDDSRRFSPIISNHKTLTADGTTETITTLGLRYVF